MLSKLPFFFIFYFSINIGYGQENPEVKIIDNNSKLIVQDTISSQPIDALSPSRAAFYSAVLPGLGQAYNKKYWKIPIVYAALGTGIYFFIDNTNQYNRYRDAYKNRLAGFDNDEFWGTDSEGNPLSSPSISNDGLIRAQRTLRRNREISLLVTIGLYALNIIDANVDAHLLQYNVDENLALKPHFIINDLDATTNLGLTLDFKF
ncbi:MAG: hypothetical protein KJO41_04260 [Bacteroidia bacterium]|nr:hypothetical protein [Bacteroidia bacterium]MBT8278192.1 hypothetical protein [Bacteroidia bacterium]NND26394.1 hypothetical protein [Flavobacteriaceae bacterium]NNK58988.1 hypothetical protein [Flavobacteriaceae bacterium]NNL32113.1 hypothetical protein [Flavobacteriaceae bacterium]